MNTIRLLSVALNIGGVLLTPSGSTARLDLTALTEGPSIEGTQWTSQGEGPSRLNVTYSFQPGGQLVYTYNGVTHRNGTWKQDGDTIYFEMNQKYRETRPTLKGDRIEGESTNTKGQRWPTILSRSNDPK